MPPRPSKPRYTPAVRDPRPCPRCYAPMRLVGKEWECEKHGKPAA